MATSEIVARLGVRVLPDTEDFGKSLRRRLRREERLRDNQFELKVDLLEPKAQDLRRMRDRVDRKIKTGHIKFRVPLAPFVKGDTVDNIDKMVDRINRSVKARKTLRFEIPVGFDKVAMLRELQNTLREVKGLLSESDRTIKLLIKVSKAQVKKEWKELKHDLSNDKVDLNVDLDRKGRARAQLATLSRNRFVDLFIRINKRSYASAAAAIEALSGVSMVRRFGRFFETFFQNIDMVALKLGNLATLMGSIGASLLTASGSIAAIFSGIGQMGGYALFLPNALASIVAFTTVGAAAFKNFKAAIDGSEDAMQALPLKAQAAARALQGTWTSIQVPTQKAFWESMGDGIVNIVKTVLPEFRTGMAQTGSSVGQFARRVVDAFTQYGGTGLFSGMFDKLSEGISNASDGMYALMDGILQLSNTGASLLPDFGSWLRDTFKRFDDWVKRNAESGQLRQWMENAATAAHDMGQAIKGIGQTLSGIADAAKKAGIGGLDKFADTMGRVSKVVNGAKFQKAMSTLFGGAHRGWANIKQGLLGLGRGLADIAPTLSYVMETSGGIVRNLFEELGKAISRPGFEDGLKSFFGGFADGAKSFLESLPELADGVGSLADLFGTIFQQFGPVLGDILENVSEEFQDLQPTLKDLTKTLAELTQNGLGMLFTTLNNVVLPALNAVLGIFNDLPTSIQTAVGMLLLFRRYTKKAFGGAAEATEKASKRGLFFTDDRWNTFGARAKEFPRTLRQSFKDAYNATKVPFVVGPGKWVNDIGRMYKDGVANLTRGVGRNVSRSITSDLETAMARSGPRMQETIRKNFVRWFRPVTGLSGEFTKTMASRIDEVATRITSTASKKIGPIVRATVTKSLSGHWGGLRTTTRDLGNQIRQALRDAGLKGSTEFRKGLDNNIRQALKTYRVPPAARREFLGHILPNPEMLRTSLSSSIDSAHLSTVVTKAIDDVPIKLTPWKTGFTNFYADIRGGMAKAADKVKRTFRGTMASIKTMGTSTLGAIRKSGRSLFNFIGGGWGAALLGGMVLFSAYESDARKIEQYAERVKQAAQDIAQAALDSGHSIQDSVGSLKAAQELMDTFSGDDVWGNISDGGVDTRSFLGQMFGGDESFEDLISKAGFSDEDISNVMVGKGSQAVIDWLKGLRDQAHDAQAGLTMDNPLGDLLRVGDVDSAHTMEKNLDSILDMAKQAKKKYDDAWSDDSIRPKLIQNVVDSIKESWEAGKKVTLENVRDIQNDVMSIPTEASDKVRMFASALAQEMGGTPLEVSKNFVAITQAMSGLGDTAGEIAKKDYIGAIIRDFKRHGKNLDPLKQGLEGIGYSVDDIDTRFASAWGTIRTSLGQPITLGGEPIWKAGQYSSGIQEFSSALASLTGINIGTIQTAAADLDKGGISLVNFGENLAKAGVSFDDIKGALELLPPGLVDVNKQLEAARLAARQMVKQGMANPAKIDAFAAAIRGVRDAAEDAASKAGDLYDALDKLQGGNLSAFDIKSQLVGDINDAMNAIKDGIKNGDIQSIMKDGVLDPASATAQQLVPIFKSIAQGSLSTMLNAYQTALDSGLDPTQALAKAQGAIAPFRDDIDGLIQSLIDSSGLAIGDVEEFKRQLGLLPKQQTLLLIAQTDGAKGQLASIALQLSQVTGTTHSIVVNEDDITWDTIATLKSMGVQVSDLTNHQYVLSIAGDDTDARNTVDGLINHINNESATLTIGFSFPDYDTWIHVQGKGRYADGGIVDFFANGGITKALSKVKSFASGSEQHVAQIAPAGAMRIWAEPETGGEAYIPLAEKKRARSLSILSSVAQRFGYALVQQGRLIRNYAEGTADTTQSATSGDTFNITNYYPQAEATSTTVARGSRYSRIR